MNIASIYNMLNAQNVYGANATAQTTKTSASFNLTASYLQMTGNTSGSYFANSLEDKADISDTAKELAQRIKKLDVFSCIFPNNDATKKTKTLGEVENDFMGDFNHFADAFGSMFSMLGLDASSSFTMGLNGVGGMTVESGDDAQTASKLQTAFTKNSTLTARFAVMAARGALADAGYTLDGFKEQYAEDPFAAITENIDALKERLLGFRTTAENGTMQYGFIRNMSVSIEYSSTTATYSRTGAAQVNGQEEKAPEEAPAAEVLA